MSVRVNLFDPAKALEVILYLGKGLKDPTFHSISKVLYCADRKHLERFGRFICGDHYIAMEYGPVPSRVYDMMKAPLGLVATSDTAAINDAFTVEAGYNLRVQRDPQVELLSKSELSCLDEALGEWGHLSFKQRTAKSHDAAWKAADPNGVISVDAIARTLPNADEVLEHLSA